MSRKAVLVFFILCIVGFCPINANEYDIDVVNSDDFLNTYEELRRKEDIDEFRDKKNRIINVKAENNVTSLTEEAEIAKKNLELLEKGIKIVSVIMTTFDIYSFAKPLKTVKEIVDIIEKKPKFNEEKAFNSVFTKLQNLRSDFRRVEKTIPELTLVLNRISEFEKNYKLVSQYYKEISLYTNDNDKTVERIETDTEKGLRIAHVNIINPGYFENSLIAEIVKNYRKIYPCGSRSEQRLYYELMIYILTAEVKGLNILLHTAEKLYKGEKRVNQQISVMQRSFRRINATINTFKRVLRTSSRTLQLCDLIEDHVKDQSYTKIEGVFERIGEITRQGQTCTDLDNTEIPKSKESKKVLNNQRVCKNAVQCFKIPFSQFCTSTNQTRGVPRYEWVKNRSVLQILGAEDDCKSDEYTNFSLEGLIKIDICNCICEESTEEYPGDRYFSLEEVTSDTASNYVVIGVRFQKVNNVIRLQIQEGKLTTAGTIHSPKKTWTPTTDYLHENKSNGTNFFQLKWPGSRGLALKTVEAPKNYLITGVKFSRNISNPLAKVDGKRLFLEYLNLEVQVTEFDPATGNLFPHTSQWKGSDYQLPRDSNLFQSKNPEPTQVGKVEHKPSNQEVVFFEPTGILTEDYGFSVTPYLDLQPIVSSGLSSPFTAIGIHSLHADKSGNFVALKAETLDVMQYVSQVENKLLKKKAL